MLGMLVTYCSGITREDPERIRGIFNKVNITDQDINPHEVAEKILSSWGDLKVMPNEERGILLRSIEGIKDNLLYHEGGENHEMALLAYAAILNVYDPKRYEEEFVLPSAVMTRKI